MTESNKNSSGNKVVEQIKSKYVLIDANILAYMYQYPDYISELRTLLSINKCHFTHFIINEVWVSTNNFYKGIDKEKEKIS